MRTLNRADLLVFNGLELEVGWLPLLIEGARNPDVVPGARGHLNASEGIDVLEVPQGEVDRSFGDIHPRGNPHYVLDPRNGILVAGTLARALSALDPDNARVYERNRDAFAGRLRERIAHWEERAAPLRGLEVVAYHKQWEYFAHWLGFAVLDYVEVKPGIPPSPRHISDLVRRMRQREVPLLLSADFIDPKAPRRVARRAGAAFLSLPVSVGGNDDVPTYTALIDHLVTRIRQAVEGGP